MQMVQISVWLYTQAIKQEGVHQRQLKMTHINFAILNNHVTVMSLTFIKNTYFYTVKKKKLKIAVFHIIYTRWLFSSNRTVSKIEWRSENLTFQNLFKICYLQKSFEISWLLTKNLTQRATNSYVSTQFY